MTDISADAMSMKLANDIRNMGSYIKIEKVNNDSGRVANKELLMIGNTSYLDKVLDVMQNASRMMGLSSGGLHESLIGSLNKGYYNEMEAGSVDGGFGPQGMNLPANSTNARRYQQQQNYGTNSNRSNSSSTNRSYQNNNSRYNNSNGYYDNNTNGMNNYNDYDNSDTYGQGPGCTPNVDGSRDRRCRDGNTGNNNYQNQGGTVIPPNTAGDKLSVDKGLLSTILTR
ncbi:unknown similar to AMEV151 [Mythimna separata entomopoxvirus 'L']|uniref:Uncharacterized protein n=1 Tax=Mythimna separata entomopoxvirus 'L' TaxID=1293572 RepID=A0A916KQE3_9POXV|nr:unknown similar to AMEV151 [Mythimna separata entomopoxvirus 'L']CCU56389.1 unknown similar to AMEV151 [Mythimna separata entomopoxvirus 'L']